MSGSGPTRTSTFGGSILGELIIRLGPFALRLDQGTGRGRQGRAR